MTYLAIPLCARNKFDVLAGLTAETNRLFGGSFTTTVARQRALANLARIERLCVETRKELRKA